MRTMATTVALLVLVLAPSASAAQRHYRVTGGTTTITFSDQWLTTLGQSSVQFGGVDGTRVTATPRRTGSPIIRATFKVRRAARANGVVFGMPGGPSVTAEHTGGLTFSSLSRPGTVAFRRPTLVRLSSSSRFHGTLPDGSGTTPFLKLASTRVGAPRGGKVRVTMTGIVWDYTGWMVFGTSPNDPPTDNPWFPKAAMNAVVGDAVTVLNVKRR